MDSPHSSLYAVCLHIPVHHRIDGHVHQHRLHAQRGAGGKADQREAHVADRRIGHQSLDIALADGGKVQMPLTKTFFSQAFGVVADRFGVPWMVVAPE